MYLKIEYDNMMHPTYFGEVVYNGFFIVVIYLNNLFISNYYFDSIESKKKMNKITYILSLIIYIIMFFNLTVVGRFGTLTGFNLIPFKTIMYFITNISLYDFEINLLGNLIILMPVQYLLIKIFDIKNFKITLISNLAIVLIIEALQLITQTGIFDIDDIILNISGMLLIWLAMKNKLFKKIIFIIALISISIIGILSFNEYKDSKLVGDISKTKIIYSNYEKEYRDEDELSNASSLIISHFATNEFKGCTLNELIVGSINTDMKEREQEKIENQNLDDAIYIEINFKTSKDSSNLFNPNKNYTYTLWCIKDKNGNWNVEEE